MNILTLNQLKEAQVGDTLCDAHYGIQVEPETNCGHAT